MAVRKAKAAPKRKKSARKKVAPRSRKTVLYGPFDYTFDRSGRLIITESRIKKSLNARAGRGGRVGSDPSNTQCCVPQGPGPILPTCGEGIYILHPVPGQQGTTG